MLSPYLNNFLSMGGYGAYVWSAYGITLAVFGINVFFTFSEKRHIKKLLNHYLTQTSHSQ